MIKVFSIYSHLVASPPPIPAPELLLRLPGLAPSDLARYSRYARYYRYSRYSRYYRSSRYSRYYRYSRHSRYSQ